MKKQHELTVGDMYPDYGMKRHNAKVRDLIEKTLFDTYSTALLCPCCERHHTPNELYFNSPATELAVMNRDEHLYCPATKCRLRFAQTLEGHQWLEINDTVY